MPEPPFVGLDGVIAHSRPYRANSEEQNRPHGTVIDIRPSYYNVWVDNAPGKNLGLSFFPALEAVQRQARHVGDTVVDTQERFVSAGRPQNTQIHIGSARIAAE